MGTITPLCLILLMAFPQATQKPSIQFVANVNRHIRLLSPHKLLTFHTKWKEGIGYVTPEIYDLTTRKKRHLATFLGRGSGFLARALSPNGQYLLFNERVSRTEEQWVIVTLESGQRVELPPTPQYTSQAAWLRDNKHWVELVKEGNKSHFVVHNFSTATNQKKIPLTQFDNKGILLWLITTKDEVILRQIVREADKASVYFHSVNLRDEAYEVKQIIKEEITSDRPPIISFSPDEQYLVWGYLFYTGVPQGDALVTAAPPPPKEIDHRMWLNVYISKADGSNKRLLGHIMDYPYISHEREMNIGWQSNEKLYTIVKDKLYSIKINP
jgi:hypothetical protein